MNVSYNEQTERKQTFQYAAARHFIGYGWRDILYDVFVFCENIYADYGIFIGITDVKEKYGALRIYYYIECAEQFADYDTDVIHQTMCALEDRSVGICEDCGAHGELLTVFGWQKTLCAECYQETIA